MSIDKTTLNRIRIAIQHALCSATDDEVNYESMAKACVDFGIIEKEEDFDDETFTHAPILFEMIWEKVGDGHFKTPLELFEAWYKDEVAIYRLGEEIEDFSELEIKVAKEDADLIAKMFGGLTDEEIQEKARASKNTAEIFCHATNGTYEEFNQYAAGISSYFPPRVGEPAIRTLKRVASLSDISINVPLLVYAVYEKMYKNNKFPYTYDDIVYDIVDSMVTLKEEGMIQ